MAIYVGVNGVAKKVIGAYIGRNNQAVPIYTGDVLPDGYLPVSHIYNTVNDNPIETNIIPGLNTKTILVGALVNTGTSNYNFLTGSGNTDNDYGIYYHYDTYNGGPKIVAVCGNTSGLSPQISASANGYNGIPTNQFIVTINKNTNKESYIKYNNTNTLLCTNTTSSLTGSAIKLAHGPGLFCYCVIYQNILSSANPAGEFYPCVRQSDSAAGLWDTVTQQFFTNKTLAYGAVIDDYNIPNLE